MKKRTDDTMRLVFRLIFVVKFSRKYYEKSAK